MGKMFLQAFGTLAVVLVIATMGCATRAPVQVSGKMAEAPPPVQEETKEPSYLVVISLPVFNHLLFDTGKTVMVPQTKAEADKIVGWLADKLEDTLTVEGHASDSETSNPAALGIRRAEVVRNYLIEQGVEPERVDVVSYGDQQPAVPNTSNEYRKLNQRAVFHLHTEFICEIVPVDEEE